MQQDDQLGQFTGRLVRDPEPHYSNDGSQRLSVNFTMATNRYRKGKEDVTYVDVRVRYKEKLAEFLLQYAVAGTHVLVRANELRAKAYVPKNGPNKDTPVGIIELDADVVKILGGARTSDSRHHESLSGRRIAESEDQLATERGETAAGDDVDIDTATPLW